MNFARKVFIGIFLSSLLISSLLIWVAHDLLKETTSENYVSRYKVFSQVLAKSLVQLERNTEVLMFNAAQVVFYEDEKKGLLSTEHLKLLREQINVTHIFVTDKQGNFIRSTNEDPKLIPNLFSFCSEYQHLISGDAKVKSTPIIPPMPEIRPYKFLTIPNYDRTRLIEVGVV